MVAIKPLDQIQQALKQQTKQESAIVQSRSSVLRSLVGLILVAAIAALVPIGMLSKGNRSAWSVFLFNALAVGLSFPIEKRIKEYRHLSELCGIDKDQRKKRDKLAIVSKYQPHLAPFRLTSDNAGQSVQCALLNQGIETRYHNTIKAPAILRVKVSPMPGWEAQDIVDQAQNLQQAFALEAEPAIGLKDGMVAIDVPRPDRQFVSLSDYVKPQWRPADSDLKLPLGLGVEGEKVEVNFSDPDNPHLLLGGKSGSGKSETGLALVVGGTYLYSPEVLQYELFDLKGSTFIGIEDKWERFAPWISSGAILTEPDPVMERLAKLRDEMLERKEFFKQVRARDIQDYNRKFPNALLPRVIIFIEEYPMLKRAGKRNQGVGRADFELILQEIAQVGRSLGYHLIITAQRPDMNTLDPGTRNQLARCALKVSTPADSGIIYGVSPEESGIPCATTLLGKGDGFFITGRGPVRFQGYYWDGVTLPPDPAEVVQQQAMLITGEVEAIASANTPAIAAAEPEQEEESDSIFDEEEALLFSRYLHYRQRRENGETVTDILGNLTADRKKVFFESIQSFTNRWAIELYEQGNPVEAIVSVVWGYVPTGRTKEKFDEQEQYLKQLLRSKQ